MQRTANQSSGLIVTHSASSGLLGAAAKLTVTGIPKSVSADLDKLTHAVDGLKADMQRHGESTQELSDKFQELQEAICGVRNDITHEIRGLAQLLYETIERLNESVERQNTLEDQLQWLAKEPLKNTETETNAPSKKKKGEPRNNPLIVSLCAYMLETILTMMVGTPCRRSSVMP